MRLIADDLTGALDSAARFTTTCGPIAVHLRHKARYDAGATALDLACRDGTRAAAVAANLQAADFLEADIAFKKIDSLLRGHWAAELAALLATDRFRYCILAPAFPEQNRVTVAGRQCLVDADGNLQPLATDIGAALAAQGLTALAGDAFRPGTTGHGPAVLVFAARTSDDLADVVHRGSRLPGRILWCGTAGLAGALAKSVNTSPARQMAGIAPTALALIGTNHPVMQAQIEAARAVADCTVVALGGDAGESAQQIAAAFDQRPYCIAHFAFADGRAPANAAMAIARRLQQLVPHLAKPAALIAAGGETLRAICEASAADHLVVLGELGPGVPFSRLVGGLWDGLPVVSRSGAFGRPTFFADLFAARQSRAFAPVHKAGSS